MTDRKIPKSAWALCALLGLAYIAAMARSLGHSVEIIDAYATGMSWSGFEQRIQELQPEVLGFSAMTPVADVVARAVRLCRPHAGKIVLGGPHPTAVGDAVFTEMPGLDAAVVGGGEPVIGPLLDWWSAGSPGDPPAGVRAPNRPFTAASPMNPSELPRPARARQASSQMRSIFNCFRTNLRLIFSAAAVKPPPLGSTQWKCTVCSSCAEATNSNGHAVRRKSR